jgi:ATP-dependent exoDNAse (exonuclease V) beta subunit
MADTGAARPAAPDQAARDRITAELDSTLFVEAGAGSGKTSALVDRVVALVESGAAELGAVAAITFTEKAAAELRDRVRTRLEGRAADADRNGDPALATRYRAALDEVDTAAIGTLHAFAQRTLSEHPVEAGLPPRVEVLDEVSSDVEFERRWGVYRDELLADPAFERSLLLFFAAGVRPDALRSLARAFGENWDLVGERVPLDAGAPPPVRGLVDAALIAIDAVCGERSDCRTNDDRLRQRLDDIADFALALRSTVDELELLTTLSGTAGKKPPSFKVGNVGSQGNWPDVRDLRARVAAAGVAVNAVRGQVLTACARHLGTALARFTLASAEERRAAGRLEFHDLLVLSRGLLRDPVHGADVRARLHGRYRRLLLDEFQDTDPIQIELAVRIAAADPASVPAGEAAWGEVDVAAGHLFVVGDPKQSIYRFRRADISTFLAAKERLGGTGAGAVGLAANFRTAAPVIDWVNHVFDALFSEPVPPDLPPSQPGYVALASVRPASPDGPAVAVNGRDAHPSDSKADDLRVAEAEAVAAAVREAVGAGWAVDDGGGRWRPARLGDMTILVPARTSLPFLEDALTDARVPYRAESSSLVYATRAVRDLLMVLRAVDDPTDSLRAVSALRTPLLACGDDDLFRFKVERRGRWSYLADQPDTVPADDPVLAGLMYLRSLHAERWWRAPSELAERVVRDRRAMELGFVEGRPRDVWRRLRFVVDQARAWHESTGGTLRQYLHWVDSQTAEGGRVAESVLPETDDDAVRIMTIHAAKGLEFPITIVSGLSTAPQRRAAPAEVVFPPTGEPGYKFGAQVTTEEFAAWAPIDEQMNHHERIRLLYVACTRPRDHLVVCLTRKERRTPLRDPSKRTNAELLVDGMGAELLASLPDAGTGVGARLSLPAPVAVTPPPTLADWSAELSGALARATRPGAVAATALTAEGAPDPAEEPDAASDRAAGFDKRPRDLDLPPWLKGRYGTAVGRAVHGVLQTIDLATGAGLDAAVAAQCEAEAIPDRTADVHRLAAAAIKSRTVMEAAGSPHWREVYTCTPIAGRLLEGYIDLLYRRGSYGLVVVDYKTAATSDPKVLNQRVGGYRLQGGSYALSVAEATGEPVVAVVFVFLTPDGAIERTLPELTVAVGNAAALVSSPIASPLRA